VKPVNLTIGNFKIHAWLLAAIWARQPIIIQFAPGVAKAPVIQKIMRFIPKYRKLILHGNVPKSILLDSSHPKLLESDDLEQLKESLLISFEEEKNSSSQPIQLVSIDDSEDFFSEICKFLKQGWLAFSSLSVEVLQSIFQTEKFRSFSLNEECSIIFLTELPRRIPIESELIKTFLARSEVTANFHLQKKFAEIRYAAEALVLEIEHGKIFHQVEVQELFDMDSQNFEKCLNIIATEFHLTIDRYISRTANRTKHLLQKITRLEGVLFVCVLVDGVFNGLLKSKRELICPLNFFRDFFPYLQTLTTMLQDTVLTQITIEFSRRNNLALLIDRNSKSGQEIVYGCLLKTEVPITIFLREVTQILTRLPENQ
jgi:hypothetical protein